jgi:hypothetical protein
MLRIRLLSLFCVTGLFIGCVTHRRVVVETAVGPSPFEKSNGAAQGELIVYSGLELAPGYDPDEQWHSAYELFLADGTLLRKVENKTGPRKLDPETVELSPGNYRAVMRTLPSGFIDLILVIEGGKSTVVCLDGTRLIGRRKAAPSDLVYLPNGSVVGWRAAPPNVPVLRPQIGDMSPQESA